MTDDKTLLTVGLELSHLRFHYANEAELCERISDHFNHLGLSFEREVRLSDTDRADFLLGGVLLEVKTQGGPAQLWRQLSRYSRHERVTVLVVVTTRRKHLQGLPRTLNGKPVRGIILG